MAIELEVEVKVQKPLSEEDFEDMENKRISGKPMMDVMNLTDESKFEYRRLIIDLADIDSRGDFDDAHTVVYLPYGAFLVKLQYDKFNFIYETLTGTAIKRISDFKFPTKRA